MNYIFPLKYVNQFIENYFSFKEIMHKPLLKDLSDFHCQNSINLHFFNNQLFSFMINFLSLILFLNKISTNNMQGFN
jgi:hypothetical protein